MNNLTMVDKITNLFLFLFLQDFVGSSLIHYSKLKGKPVGPSASGRSMKKGSGNKGPVLISKPKNYDKIVAKVEEENGHLVEGEFDEKIEENAIPRGGTSDISKRWDYKMIIVIDTSFTLSTRETILSAIYTVSEVMECFEFSVMTKGEKISNRKNHLYIQKGQRGCFSVLGKSGGRQVTTISDNCYIYGTTIHEIMHVLGFFHEHVRPDRDKYVVIDWSVLDTGDKKHQYKIRGNQIIYNEKYDFDSLMHYPPGRALQPKKGMMQPGDVPGQRNHLSEMDKIRLKGMYPCEDKEET